MHEYILYIYSSIQYIFKKHYKLCLQVVYKNDFLNYVPRKYWIIFKKN